MHSRTRTPLAGRPQESPPVSALQPIEFVAGFLVCLPPPSRPPTTGRRAGPTTLHLRTDLSTRQCAAWGECRKKNHLERNAEVGVMIQNATKSFSDGARYSIATPGR